MLTVFASIYTIFPFQQLIDVNNAILKFWHDQVGLSWGASIIGLTVVIRLLILPLSFKQVRSMQEMQRIQPEVKKLQQRFKEDKKRMNEELMKLYQEHGVNPFGSCLPIVLQLPFFFALFGLQRSATFKHEVCPPHGVCSIHGHELPLGQHFLFIPNILNPLTGGALVVVIILYAATMLGSSLVTATSIQDKNQRRMMFILPLIFIPFVIRFPAGLLIYWITTNLWTIGQQLLIKRVFPPLTPVPAGAAAGGGTTSAAKAGSGAGAKQGTWGNRFMKALAGAAEDGAKAKEQQSRARPQGEKPKRQEPKATGARKAGSSRNGSGDGSPQKPPPRSPRKRKKRSGRRR